MRVVIDTNILLVSLKRGSTNRPIFEGLLNDKYHLVITNEILSEYLEIIGEKTNKEIASNLGDLLTRLTNIDKIETYYNWLLITEDPDDDKFVDAAIAGNTDYIVTNDRHFRILKGIEFPKVNICSSKEFLEILDEL
ncbi:putative toxin-antitoxin system toxin component, PIN family [Neolewinella antarctica]|uniref:PIN family toxin of toxin-antitoxin system n=1 Tax=Neolewinella antarctica TaxID=442734 RepID=A0ABX0XGP4_9BACT|nr:putative toxin-antitoxin system toxin component, PIN family [Neolewinella antarctica]NJC28509.1 putative PIN family toxin of toxin-antitoxin system [Neolewinella antarctica]